VVLIRNADADQAQSRMSEDESGDQLLGSCDAKLTPFAPLDQRLYPVIRGAERSRGSRLSKTPRPPPARFTNPSSSIVSGRAARGDIEGSVPQPLSFFGVPGPNHVISASVQLRLSALCGVDHESREAQGRAAWRSAARSRIRLASAFARVRERRTYRCDCSCARRRISAASLFAVAINA
jgi:hypothetical protein